jgi:uncharacterized membrane protein
MLTTLAAPNGLSPEQIHKAYNLPCTPGGPISWKCDTPTTFGPEIVAIVGAFHTPTMESALAVYDETFGIPPCTKANGCLTVVNKDGQTSPLPSGQSSDWAIEAALDVQTAHATCQTCKILLIEADSNSWINMASANQKVAQMGATVVSNSYGNYEVQGYHTQFDQYYVYPDVAITASSGDWGYGTLYPAASKNVIGVGGTELYLFNDNTYASESVWGGAGSGCSIDQSAGAQQTSLPNWSQTGCGNKKAISDVSAVASPNTGAAIYVGGNGWMIVGGTSLSSPLYAATIALQGGIPQGSDGAVFPYTQKDKFRDVTIGSNGSCGGKSICTAGVGYDGPTGLGSPKLLADPQPTYPPVTPSPNASPTPTPTTVSASCSAVPKVQLSTAKQALPGDIMNTSLFITNNDPSSCTSSFTISYETPTGWVVTTIPTEKSINGGVFTSVNFDTIVPLSETDGSYNLKFFIKKDGITYTANAQISVMQAIPTPTPIIANADQCQANTTMTLQDALAVGVPGSPVNGTLSIKSNNASNCSTTYYLTYSQTNFSTIPTWKFDGIPSSITLTGGETKQIPFTMTASTNGLVAGNYIYHIWATRKDGSNNYPNGVATGRVQVQQIGSNVQDCTTQQTVTLSQTQPILALPGDTVLNTLTIKNNDTPTCPSLLYTISQGYPTGWTFTGIPSSVTLAAGATKTINLSIIVPFTATAGNYGYQFWVAKPGESSPIPVNGSVQVAQVGPTPTPTPTPINCFQGWTNSLGSTSMSGKAGDTINETLTITYNNPPSCGTATFGISYSYPSGWIINGLMPPSVKLTGGQSVTIPISITISTGAQVQDYLLQFWVNNGSNNMNATVHVLSASQPPTQQMFSNLNAKMYGTYSLFEYSYNATGAVGMRLDVATDPTALNQTVGPNANARYGFAYNYGSPMDASNLPTPTTIEGLINSSPQAWDGWKCGSTIYYRIYNSGDLRIASPVSSATVDCTTVVNVLPWDPWYAAIYQGVYDSRYDVDNNGKVDWNDYWILVRATRLR